MLWLSVRRERRRKYVAPVREERTVDFIARSLYGIAKERWLEKWARWIDELIRRYNVEDIQKALGIIDIHDLRELERFLIENCSGLTESECLDRIRSRLREQGYRENVTEEMIQSLIDYIRTVEKKPEIEYGFPYDIRARVGELRARPELDRSKAFELVYEFLVKEGTPEDEARRIAEEVAATIPKLPPAKRKDIYEYALTQARYVKQVSLDRWLRREKEAERVAKEAKEDMKRDDWIPDIAREVLAGAEARIRKKLARRLTPDEMDRLKKVVYARLQELYDEGLGYEEAKKLVEPLVLDAEREFFNSMRLYSKMKEVLKGIKLPPIYAKPELIKGVNIVSLDTLRSLGVKLQPARRTRTVDETVKVIADWARARGLVPMTVRSLRVTRSELPNVYIVYYPDREPRGCRIDCRNNECDILGCDKDTVIYMVRGNTCYILPIKISK